MISTEQIKKKTEEYIHACYFLWLKRPVDPLDLSPPKSLGEDICIGHHIKKVKSFHAWFKKNKIDLPVFDPDRVHDQQ